MSEIDFTTDFQNDSGRRDPDRYSPLLQEYHRLLWTRPLPSGELFALSSVKVGGARVLRYVGPRGNFSLSSDTLANSSRGQRREFYDAMGVDSNTEWHRNGGTIGGRLLFPSNRVDRKQTINQRRGTHPRIRDRFDYTLEAIRRHYIGDASPLSDVLSRYGEFFDLFDDFAGYVDFFLLQDLVDRHDGVRFYLPFADFDGPVLPDTMDEYKEFRRAQLEFVSARNDRMRQSLAGLS